MQVHILGLKIPLTKLLAKIAFYVMAITFFPCATVYESNQWKTLIIRYPIVMLKVGC